MLQFTLRKEPEHASLIITSMNPSRGTVLSFQMAVYTRILSVDTSLYLVRNGAEEKIRVSFEHSHNIQKQQTIDSRE